jgi:hypothetical protein
MIIKRLLQVNLFISAIIAITFIFLPEITLALYGLSGGSSLLIIAQYFGTTHLAFAVLLWFALRLDEPRFLRIIAISFFAGDLAGTILLLIAQLRGLMDPTGWVLVGMSALFAAGYGWGVFRNLPD